MTAAARSLTVQVPLTIRRRPGRKTVVTPVREAGDGPTTIPTRAASALVEALARAFRYQWLLDEGHYGSIIERAAAEKMERGYLGSLLRLMLLTPEIVEEVLGGSRSRLVDLPSLLVPLPVEWARQGTCPR